MKIELETLQQKVFICETCDKRSPHRNEICQCEITHKKGKCEHTKVHYEFDYELDYDGIIMEKIGVVMVCDDCHSNLDAYYVTMDDCIADKKELKEFTKDLFELLEAHSCETSYAYWVKK